MTGCALKWRGRFDPNCVGAVSTPVLGARLSAAALMLSAWAIELVLGWPDWLYKRLRHPVVWFGSLITILDKAFNQAQWPHRLRYFVGLVCTAVLIGAAVGFGIWITALLPNTWWGYGLEALFGASLIASRSLHAHVAAIAQPLAKGDTDAARGAVSMIVGRDPNALDEAGIARAGLESLAENTSDGVIAPIFWGALFGLPGLVGYKAINTLDSMIGHRNETYSAFGGVAARLDDVANFVPARITGFLFSAVSLNSSAFKTMLRDARKHRSPNAGWPEAAMAGGLGVRLSGPRVYGHQVNKEPWLNAKARDPNAADLIRGLRRYWCALFVAAIFLTLIAGIQVI